MINNDNLYNFKAIHLKKNDKGFRIFKPVLYGVKKPKDIFSFYPLKDKNNFINNDVKYDNHDLPVFSQWFNINSIHQIEMNNWPEFFNSTAPSKNKETYKFIRNFIWDLYLINNKEYLTFSAIRRSLNGDIGSLLRIYKFLNCWFIINYKAINNNFKIKEVLDVNLFLPYYKLNKNNNHEVKKMLETDICINPNDLNSLYNYERPLCNDCQNICGLTWMIKETKEDSLNNYIVCMECFNKLGENHDSEEYVRKTISKDKILKPWSYIEKQKILNFLQNLKENINYEDLFNQFKDRNKEEIILEILKVSKDHLFFEKFDNIKDLNNPLSKRKSQFKDYILNLKLKNNKTKDIDTINIDELPNIDKKKNFPNLKKSFKKHLSMLDNKIKFANHLEDIVNFDRIKINKH